MMKKAIKIILILGIAVTILACSTLSFSRDEGGKLLVETNLPLTLVENTIENMAELSQLEGLQMELREGYIFVSAVSINFEGFTFQDISFHLELSVVNQQLVVEITNVDVAGSGLDDYLFTTVNQMIAERLAQSQEQMERAELVDVSVSPDGIKLVWRVDSSVGN
jgi:hypothetical protein